MSDSPFEIDPPRYRPTGKSSAFPIFISVFLAIVAAGVVLVVGIRYYLHWSIRDTLQKTEENLKVDRAMDARFQAELDKMQAEDAERGRRQDADETAAISLMEASLNAAREGDWEGYLKIAGQILEKYPGTRAARTAREWLNDPQAQDLAKQQKESKQKEVNEKERRAKAREIAEMLAKNDAAAKTKWDQEQAEKKELAARDAAQAKLKANEVKAAGLLAIAREFADRGQTDKAVDRLRKIVKDYPDTKAAGEARDLLKQLER